MYHCLADLRPPGTPDGLTAQHNTYPAGTKISNARSVSMSQAVGTLGFYASGGGTKAVYGPWLSGSHNEAPQSTWYTYGKTSSMLKPGPQSTFTILDEDKYSINEGGLAHVGPNITPVYEEIDWPGTYHGGACGVAFGDNHSEIHKQKDKRSYLNGPASTVTQSGNVDIWWFAVRTSALVNGPTFASP